MSRDPPLLNWENEPTQPLAILQSHFRPFHHLFHFIFIFQQTIIAFNFFIVFRDLSFVEFWIVELENMSSEDQKAEYVSRAKLSEQAERYDDMAEFMRLVTESGIGTMQFFVALFWQVFRVDERGTQSALRRIQERRRISPQLMASHLLHWAKVWSRREKIGEKIHDFFQSKIPMVEFFETV